jgi:quinol monooxygenase YgiN
MPLLTYFRCHARAAKTSARPASWAHPASAFCLQAPWSMSMSHVLIIHEVEDYPAWKKIFDEAAGIRKEAGERSYQILKYQDDPNRIVHFSAWTSLARARAFFESPRLVQIRKEAGVKAPAFIYLDEIEAGDL